MAVGQADVVRHCDAVVRHPGVVAVPRQKVGYARPGATNRRAVDAIWQVNQYIRKV